MSQEKKCKFYTTADSQTKLNFQIEILRKTVKVCLWEKKRREKKWGMFFVEDGENPDKFFFESFVTTYNVGWQWY